MSSVNLTLKCNSRKLPVYPRDIYKNVKGYWVMGVNDPKSWDSKYWGEIKKMQFLAKLNALKIVTEK